jgi:8-oxo-dGTP pyrophosphatase MutT (NUDIX family)
MEGTAPFTVTAHALSLGAGSVIVHEQRVLLVRNRYGVTRGRYLLPAGRVRAGELPDQTAVREAFEETNLRIAIEGLLGIRLWVMENGEQNYFFMFLARLLSAAQELRPNLAEIDDARFFSREELAALTPGETWAGAVAIARKGLDADGSLWRNHGELADTPGLDAAGRWRMWL